MKILYGVAGEGMGHAIRSKAVIEELSKQHDVLVAAGDRAYKFLKKSFKTSHIHCFNIIYRNNTVSNFLTFIHNTLKFPVMFFYNLKLFEIVAKFKPDVIITDFEPFTNYIALLTRKKCICIDNQQIITNTKYNIKGNFFDRITAKLVVHSITPYADYSLVPTFFYPKVRSNNTFLFPPILRKEILDAKTRQGKHILVYQTSMSQKSLIPTLKQVNEKFIVYDLNQKGKQGNVTFKKFNEKEFIKDLASCKAVIANGGFSLMSEAIHLHKPFLCIPVKRQFEQILNGVHLNRLGFGMHSKYLNKKTILKFLNKLDYYNKNLEDYKKEDNSSLFIKLEQLISQK